MLNEVNRRTFLKSTSVGALTYLGSTQLAHAEAWLTPPAPELYTLSRRLLETWVDALLKLQVTDRSNTLDYGGIVSPANGKVHGRVADTIYPLAYLARHTQRSRYQEAILPLYEWMERNVSQPDGSWLNEPVKGSWKGTNVFTIIALAETLRTHAGILDTAFKTRLLERLKKAGDYVYNTFTIEYGNINYPINAAYALTLLGDLLNLPAYKEKGRLFAHQALNCFTSPNNFLYGEGSLKPSAKGCFPVDLGYNVEESLPALTLYGIYTHDEEVLQKVTQSMQTHLQFMLPDGGWDNSWGTRNYKWTYWGSRTTDGCLPAYGLLASRDAQFYQAALQNTRLLQKCTHQGLLTGGPHYTTAGAKTSVHHTFCHAKALTTLLDYGNPALQLPHNLVLPRSQAYDYKFFPEIQTYLIAQGDFRATITGYDCEYKNYKAGHATGGALTLLWHPLTGPLLAGSMTEYQLLEADNMQPNTDRLSMPLTPRIEWKIDWQTYSNINDLSARMEVSKNGDSVQVRTFSKLVDRSQQMCPPGHVECRVTYTFTPKQVSIHFEHDLAEHGSLIDIIIPVIAASTQSVQKVNTHQLNVRQAKATLAVKANQAIEISPTSNGRVFNYVPGLQAVPLRFKNGASVSFTVQSHF